jgi:hypothetical protein
MVRGLRPNGPPAAKERGDRHGTAEILKTIYTTFGVVSSSLILRSLDKDGDPGVRC